MWLLSLNEALHWSLVFPLCGASQVVQWVKNPPAMQEMQVRFLGQEDPLEDSMATHASILAWRTPWTEEPGGPQSMGLKELEMTETTEHSCTHISSLWHELRDNSAQKINTSKCDCNTCDSLDYL